MKQNTVAQNVATNGPARVVKPPYKVPSMAEIESIPWNGFNVVSTFSGCGGSCLGYRLAGFKVLWASEFIPAAQEVYKLNHPNSILDTRDIRKVKPEEILEAIGLKVGELDLLDGSPPCASFSTAGKREKGWGQVKQYSDTKQRVDDLFFEYTRILKGLQPKVFVAENVSGLVKGTAKGYFLEILKELKACGYNVKAKLLDAQWLGVPQMRQRVIFMGVRNDLGLASVYPEPLPYRYSVREAILDVTEVESETWLKGKTLDIAKKLKPGQCGSDVEGQGSYFSLKRLDFSDPAGTVQQSEGKMASTNQVHPVEHRRLSISELKRICAFPDDFQLTGSYAQQWERLGRAVPPVMMYWIAKAVKEQVLDKCAG